MCACVCLCMCVCGGIVLLAELLNSATFAVRSDCMFKNGFFSLIYIASNRDSLGAAVHLSTIMYYLLGYSYIFQCCAGL